MDFAYDFINDRSATPKPGETAGSDTETSATTPTRSSEGAQPQRQDLQTEFQETFKAFSNSPWGAKLGGWWSTARTQGASYYETARKEAEKREAEAAKALDDARKVVLERTKTMVEAAENQLDNIVNEEKKAEQETARKQQEQETAAQKQSDEDGIAKSATDPTSSSVEEDTDTFLARFKSEAAKRLREVQKAEDAADEALLRFGTNIRNFLKDTISITAPDDPTSTSQSSEVLFESRDATTGKRVIHTSRFDAQLHVIHTTLSSFIEDPSTDDGQYESFKNEFNIEKKTDSIAKDLDKYPDLRTAMEKLVPEKVEYKDFWTRYYFLRHVVEVREEKRKELLKGESPLCNSNKSTELSARILTRHDTASTANQEDDEEVGWDEDSDSESAHTDKQQKESSTSQPEPQPAAVTSQHHTRTDSDALTIRQPRRSHDEKSVADSEASYDLVSGAASHANSSPKEKPIKEVEESDDDDWE